MASFLEDIKYSLRRLVKLPVFSLVAVFSLALGIGVNTAIFSALDALLLRPLAVRDLDRTVIVYDTSVQNADAGTSFPVFRILQDRRETFSGVMAIAGARPLSMIDGDRREQVFAELVTADFFSIADVTLQLGRPLGREIDRVDDPPSVAVLSHAFWQRRFGADPAIVGKTIVLNGQPFVAMGVARPGFTGLDAEVSADLWVPMTTWAHLMGESGRLTGAEHWITTVAALQPGVTVEQARAAVAVAARQVPQTPGQRTQVRPARQRTMLSAVDTLAISAAAFGGGLLVLALACANVTSLLLARAAGRQREMSVRMALGSSRARLVRLWVSESLVLCVLAGGIGLLVASWLLDLVVAFKPPTEIGQSESPTLPIGFQLDVRVFAFALGLSTLVAVVVGLISGLQGSKPGVTRAITSDRVTDRRFAPGFNVRSAVIALQVSLSLLLLIPCGLFVRSWLNSSAMATGFSADHVLLLPISSNQAGVRVRKPAGFEQELSDRIARLPGVESATVMDPVPLWFGGKSAFFGVDGSAAAERGHRLLYSCIGPGYFDTLKIPLLRGRDFNRSDSASAPFVAIVNETLARRLWPGGNALGQRLRSHDGVLEVVGIARDAKYLSLAETDEPYLYRPIAQRESDNPALSLAVRTTGDPMRMRAAVEREVKSLAPGWPSFQFRTLDEGVQLQRSLPRFGATLLGVLGAFGALLAAVGIYGVMAYVVQQRAGEIGIRLALGAPGFSVVGLMIRQGMAVCAAGGALGLMVALGVTQFLRSVLYGVSAADPVAYATVSALLLGVAFLACYLPARHAATVNPVEVLRRE
jgi:putative ABC transport system permease protein